MAHFEMYGKEPEIFASSKGYLCWEGGSFMSEADLLMKMCIFNKQMINFYLTLIFEWVTFTFVFLSFS